MCRQILAADPGHVGANHLIGIIALQTGDFQGAAEWIAKALDARPDYPEAWSNLGVAFKELGRIEDAAEAFRKAIASRPDYAEAHCNLGVVLRARGMAEAAIASCRRAVELKPDYDQAHFNLGNALYDVGRMDDAVACFRKTLAISPGLTKAHNNLLVTMSFLSSIEPETVLATARQAGAAFEAPFKRRHSARHGNDPDPDRRLRVGYLSPSLAAHVLTPYIEPLLGAHNRENVSVAVYAHVPNADEVTRRLEALADSWTFVHDFSDDRLAQRIAEDRIDILVDPMGHWGDNRLSVFARKPAPIQVSYLSQGMTTGLSAMDYTVGDRWLNFDGAMQAFATERVVELPSGFQVTAFDQEPAIGPPPAAENGFITFASFNNPAKISDASLKLWAAVLDRVPDARLLIKGQWLERPEKRAVMSKRLVDVGIAAGKVELMGYVPLPEALGFHNRADIMLDTTPFSGGRTTADAVWMGVPVVTLIGNTVYGRFSYSHLARTGVPELAAKDAAGFVDIAVALAGDADRLAHYRRTLRPALRASSLLDAERHAAELEDAYRVMWRRWCDGREPEAFALAGESGPTT